MRGRKWDDDKCPPLPETESLWHIGQSKSHRHLLKHPVITSFLWCKWTRIRRFFNRNLRFYLLFVYVLTWYIFDEFGGGVKGPGCKPRVQASSTAVFFGLYVALTIVVFGFVFKDWRQVLLYHFTTLQSMMNAKLSKQRF